MAVVDGAVAEGMVSFPMHEVVANLTAYAVCQQSSDHMFLGGDDKPSAKKRVVVWQEQLYLTEIIKMTRLQALSFFTQQDIKVAFTPLQLLCFEVFAIQRRFDVVLPGKILTEMSIAAAHKLDIDGLSRHFNVPFLQPDPAIIDMFDNKTRFMHWMSEHGLKAFTPAV